MADKLDRFSKHARDVLTAAQGHALRLNHDTIGPEHILLGIVSQENRAVRILRELMVEPEQITQALEQTIARRDAPPIGKPRLHDSAKRVIEMAVQELWKVDENDVDTVHLLLGVLRQEESHAVQVLKVAGVDEVRVRAQLVQVQRERQRLAGLMQQQVIEPEFTLADYDTAAESIRASTSHQPRIGMILGSGLSPLADQIEDATIIPYEEIPHFPVSTVHGHAGQLVIGTLAGAEVLVMQGRFHFYEGYSMQQITLPVRVMKRLGIETLILTNAAGGVNTNFEVGDLMLIEDHLNMVGMTGLNPLMGPNLEEFGTRFPAMNRMWTRQLRNLANDVAQELDMTLQHGVYAWLSGPTFETPAEIRYLQGIGADAVGMSTVPEAMVARHADMDVLGISTITNMCISELDSDTEPTHEEVNEAGKIIMPRLMTLLLGVLERMKG